ncbi:hypothetical protein AYR62_13105 [Secundilactobacillus paracollinoides]|uniref:TOTE conflict system primase domain-containing protein n=1 Tax=Secundilactobacillus paracollinoides TaxID=240427 RepID=A0A1B2IWI4_9LACO|nr:hypothetical protein [Secundilactobacillus paracollinoides]ANZ60571.1 hypothetical protein AYR61_03895 [Secundilactobacillus paracollinoides]ANZ64918.1 hypothetical protein AYR62_13105 [Secundilactobacillus paracollinoides]ANZ66436.1 hypothetical protein AYR63_04335 [Secundilactobacillus paracollinoides]
MAKQFYIDERGRQFCLTSIAVDRNTKSKLAVYTVDDDSQVWAEPLDQFRARFHAKKSAKITVQTEPNTKLQTNTHLTTTQKIALYRQRFNARQDVYADRYFNKKLQKNVYSPKTGFYSNGQKDYKHPWPLTDAVIKAHLKGEAFIGLYPMLKDDTTNFLVIDIDKHNWQSISQSILKVCHKYDLPVAMERSQSGNGSHLWFFFSEPILAETARKLGMYVLREAMTTDPDISFEAFDRLFPSQDVLSRKGFGNLIAAPLQYKAMKDNDGSLFIDEKFNAYADQWQFLAQIGTLTGEQVSATLGKLTHLNYCITIYRRLKKDSALFAVTNCTLIKRNSPLSRSMPLSGRPPLLIPISFKNKRIG